MYELSHWHPVMRVRDLTRKPVGIKLCGREIVIFRSNSGEIGGAGRCLLPSWNEAQ